MMAIIQLKPLLHRGAEKIGIYFQKDPIIEGHIRRIKGIKWSQTHCCWYVPLTREAYDQLVISLKGIEKPDIFLLKEYLIRRRQVQSVAVTTQATRGIQRLVHSSAWKLGKENLEALKKFTEQLKLKAYSRSTIKTYCNEFLQLLVLLKKKPVDTLTQNDLRRYFVYCFDKLKLSENTLHSRINAIKFYFEQVLKEEKFFWEIPRPKKPIQLPKVLSEKEISKLFNAARFLKHKAILFTAYSADLE